MNAVWSIAYTALSLYVWVLIGRLVFDYIAIFSRSWRPKGPILVLAEFLYTLTDPPLRALRRVIPPIRIGSVSLDLSFLVLIVGIQFVRSLLP